MRCGSEKRLGLTGNLTRWGGEGELSVEKTNSQGGKPRKKTSVEDPTVVGLRLRGKKAQMGKAKTGKG